MAHTILASENDAGRRLDRWLKKYLAKAPLSLIYKLIRKDIKVNGSRKDVDYQICAGDEIVIFLSSDEIDELMDERIAQAGAVLGAAPGPHGSAAHTHARCPVPIAYEDEHILALVKPAGLLTHGDMEEKKHTLANIAVDYLIASGAYKPDGSGVFTPAPVNRLDRNTSGIVVFGKDSKATRDFAWMIAHEGYVKKFYTVLALGRLEGTELRDYMVKDADENKVRVLTSEETRRAEQSGEKPRLMITRVRPLETPELRGLHDKRGFTLAEVELVTGRPHQIRAHLAHIGCPVLGDPKYGDPAVNAEAFKTCDIKHQLLHAARLEVTEGHETLSYLTGCVMEAALPSEFTQAIRLLSAGSGA